MSCTTSSVGANSASSMSQIWDSPSERYVGFSGVLVEAAAGSCGCAAAKVTGVDVEKGWHLARCWGSWAREMRDVTVTSCWLGAATESDRLCVARINPRPGSASEGRTLRALRARRQARQIMVGAIRCNSQIYRGWASVVSCTGTCWNWKATQFLQDEQRCKFGFGDAELSKAQAQINPSTTESSKPRAGFTIRVLVIGSVAPLCGETHIAVEFSWPMPSRACGQTRQTSCGID
jgi:hypothetical protein